MSSRDDEPRALIRLLWPHLRPQWRPLALALTLGLTIAALAAVQPLLTRFAIDDGLIGRRYVPLLEACAAMIALAATGLALGGLHRFIYLRASGRALFALRAEVYAHLLQVSPRHLSRLPIGDLVARLDGDIAEVQRFGTDAAAAALSSALTLVAAGAVMLAMSWRLTLVVAGLLPAQLLVRHFARPRIESSTRETREAAAGVGSFLVETLSAARVVQGAAAQDGEKRKLLRIGEGFLDKLQRQQVVTYATGAAGGLLGHCATAAVFLIGGYSVLHGRLSVGTLVAFIAYLGRSAGSAGSLAGLYTAYQRARVSLARVRELLALPRVSTQAAARPIGCDARGALRFESVTVNGPQDGGAILAAFDIDIPAGSKVHLRGPSGAGKSTIADLLRRFLEPDAGRILLDGHPLAAYRLEDLRRRVVVVEDEPRLFRGSILDNIRYGDHAASRSEADVIAAARIAGVEEFVSQLPQGYATPVGEFGVGLSLGQRQRIAIARAVLADPLLVVLDEATSGLEIEAVRALDAALDAAFPDRTRIVISHRNVEWTGRQGRALELRDGRLHDAGSARADV